MEKIYSLINFIKAYYPDSNIPMYLFSDEKCIFCMPEQNELTHPPFQYLRELFSGSDRSLTVRLNMESCFALLD